MSGSSLTTKGLIGGGSAAAPLVDVTPQAPDEQLVFDAEIPRNEVVIVVPTAPHVVLMAAENITANLRVRQAASLQLPSLYRRAFLVTRETDEIALVRVR